MNCKNCCNMGCKYRFIPVRIRTQFGKKPKLFIGETEIISENDRGTTIPRNTSIRVDGYEFNFNLKCKYQPDGVE